MSSHVDRSYSSQAKSESSPAGHSKTFTTLCSTDTELPASVPYLYPHPRAHSVLLILHCRPVPGLALPLPRTAHRPRRRCTHIRQMQRQPFLPIFMLRMTLANLLQAISHQQLIVARREDRCRHVHQNTNPRIRGKGVGAEEDGSYDTRAEVTGEIGGDGVSCEAPDHDRVGDADSKGYRDRGDEGVCRVKARPDHDTDEAVDEEFLEEDIALVRLVGIWKGAEDARHAAVEGSRTERLQVECLCGLDLGPVAAHQ